LKKKTRISQEAEGQQPDTKESYCQEAGTAEVAAEAEVPLHILCRIVRVPLHLFCRFVRVPLRFLCRMLLAHSRSHHQIAVAHHQIAVSLRVRIPLRFLRRMQIEEEVEAEAEYHSHSCKM
jgi:hypothetical protein